MYNEKIEKRFSEKGPRIINIGKNINVNLKNKLILSLII